MARKVSFDNLPAAVGKILEILTAEGSEHTATPEILQRVKLLEKRLDSIERMLSPGRRTMDKKTVLRVLKIRPRMLSELETSGVLLSHSEGRGTVYFEDDVVKCFMNQSAWKAAVEEAPRLAPDAPAGVPSRVDIYGASRILDRTPGAIRQHLSSLPHEKIGGKLYFAPEALEEWARSHPPLKRKPRNHETETA